MKTKCPECKTTLDLSINDYDEGDPYECPECNTALIVKVKNGKLTLKTEREEIYDEMNEDDDEFSDYEED